MIAIVLENLIIYDKYAYKPNNIHVAREESTRVFDRADVYTVSSSA